MSLIGKLLGTLVKKGRLTLVTEIGRASCRERV